MGTYLLEQDDNRGYFDGGDGSFYDLPDINLNIFVQATATNKVTDLRDTTGYSGDDISRRPAGKDTNIWG